jgi:hypothetical protein
MSIALKYRKLPDLAVGQPVRVNKPNNDKLINTHLIHLSSNRNFSTKLCQTQKLKCKMKNNGSKAPLPRSAIRVTLICAIAAKGQLVNTDLV